MTLVTIVRPDVAICGLAHIDSSRVADSVALQTFLADGAYNATNWITGDLISAQRMNKLEDGLFWNNYYAKLSVDTYDQLADIDVIYIAEGTHFAYVKNEDKFYYYTEEKQWQELKTGGADVTTLLKDYAKTSDIPTKVSQLINDKGYLVSIPEQYATKQYVDNEIKEQLGDIDVDIDLTEYATKEYVDQEIQTIELTPGPQGEPGPQGPQGIQGIQGPKGEKGDKGDPGEAVTNISQLIDDIGLVKQSEVEELSKEIAHCITPEMFGAIGDGVTDDSMAIQLAIDTAGNTTPVYLSRKNYKISTGLIIRTNYSVFRCDGTLTYEGTEAAVTLTNTLRSEVKVNTIYAQNGTALRLSNVDGRVTFNQVSVNNIRSSKVGIHLTTPTYSNFPIYYNKISFMDIISSEKGIHVEPIGYYINENRYYGGTIGGGCFYGIKIGNTNDYFSSGSNKFLSGGIEGIDENGYGIFIENSGFNIFRNIRTLERYGRYVIALKGSSLSNRIEIDVISLAQVDISELSEISNGYNELRAMSMSCDGSTLISKEVRVSSLYGFSYDTRSSNRAYYLVTAGMFENNVIQQIDNVKIPSSLRFDNPELDGLTFTLGPVYTALTSLVRGLPLTISFGSENGKIKILDEDGSIVVDNTKGDYAGQTVSVCWDGHSQYNSKNIWNVTFQEGAFQSNEFKILKNDVTGIKTNLENHINQIAGFLPEVPEEYRQVEYIQSDGNQYFNTGVLASDHPEGLKYVFDGTVVDYDSNISEYLWGALANGRRSGYVNINDETMRFLVNIGNSSSAAGFVSMTIGERVVLELTCTPENPLGMTFYKNGTEAHYFIVDNSSSSPMPNAHIYLLRLNGSSATTYTKARIYKFSMYKTDGTVLRNFIPCYRKADLVVGLYDTATGTFFTNLGTGEFTKGVEVFSPFEGQDERYNALEDRIKILEEMLVDGSEVEY